MLINQRKPVSLSIISTDLPVWSVVQTAATLYQKEDNRFHLVLCEPPIHSLDTPASAMTARLLWLEISPYRVIMTMQGSGQCGYRHYWEQGVCGLSRYWLPNDSFQRPEHIRLRNYTYKLELKGRTVPEHLLLEYELRSHQVQLGSYILKLEIQH